MGSIKRYIPENRRLAKIANIPVEEQLDSLQLKYNNLVEANLFSSNKNDLMNVLSGVFSKSLATKTQIVKEVDKVKNSFLYQGIMDLIINDSLAPSTITNEIIEVTSENKKIQAALKELQEKIDFDGLALQISEDLLSFGEYYTSIVTNKKTGRVEEIRDDVCQSEVVSVYKGLIPVKYLKVEEKNTITTIKQIDPNSLAHFIIGNRKIRIKVKGTTFEEYVRIGRPLFWGTFDLLKNLQLMTTLIPASQLQKINNTSIISIQVPETTDPDDAFKICRKYENLLNKAVSHNPSNGDITVTDMLNTAGKFKIVPDFGSKGALAKVDPRFEDATDTSILTEIKKDILASVGVPFGFLYGGDLSKAENLKQFARYVRKLHMTQVAIATGFKQIARVDLLAQGIKLAPNSLQVRFGNAPVSVDELDKVEFLDSLITTLGNTMETLSNISARAQIAMDSQELGKFLNKFLKIINLEKLFKFDKQKEIAPLEASFTQTSKFDKVVEHFTDNKNIQHELTNLRKLIGE